MWIAELADDVGRGVPARIRVHHEDQADREAGADDLRGVLRARGEADRLVTASGKAQAVYELAERTTSQRVAIALFERENSVVDDDTYEFFLAATTAHLFKISTSRESSVPRPIGVAAMAAK